ncbi:hypothetical protein, partial [Moraxella caviae]|uniref:hypothetical protein n=1 Tax=Moraxella caviae TaxID=34060 RepID=UPI000E1BFBD9
MNVAAEIRKDILCARCKLCKLLIWKKDPYMERLEKRGNLIYHEGAEHHFFAYCSWLKEGIIHPELLVKCENFLDKQRGAG